MSKELLSVFDILGGDEEPTKKSNPPKVKDSPTSELDEIFRVDDKVYDEEGQVTVSIDAKKVAKFNHFIQTKLAKVYALSEKAAETLVNGIEAGDVDGRSLDGTAKIIEASVKALSEMNQLNLLLHKQLVDKKGSAEVDRLKEELRERKISGNREMILDQLVTLKEAEKIDDMKAFSDAIDKGKK